MRVGIIGAGFTGLTAAYQLAKSGHQIQVFEKESQPGGLAIGFKSSGWDWALEKHYHHLFVSDWHIRNLAAKVGHPITFIRPKTSTWIDNRITQLDSPLSLLKFNHLSLSSRLRTALGLSLMRFNPFWQPFEYFTAKKYITTIMGTSSWEKLWEPLFVGKFDKSADIVSAAWFWSRIYKRSSSLGYPEGGFQSLADSLEHAAKTAGAKFKYNYSIDSISPLLKKFDKVICTLPTPMFEKISGLKYKKLTGIGAVNLVLALDRQFLSDGTYWLNINDRSMPFLAVVEHTNLVNKSHYAGTHFLYVGNYLPPDHRFFNLTNDELTNIFIPHLKKINPKFKKNWIRSSWVWKTPFAQPIVTPHYSRLIPPLTTHTPNLYLANIQQVYPWDRGTNYAVEIGYKVARLI